jgi:hypothetical protein
MSSGLKMDRADTAYAARLYNLSRKNRNWLRHGKSTSAGKIDEMLFDGATIELMARRARTTKATVYVHLTHLRKAHKLTIVKEEGIFRYEVGGTRGKTKAGK